MSPAKWICEIDHDLNSRSYDLDDLEEEEGEDIND